MATLTPIPRDVLTMLKVELRSVQSGDYHLHPDENGVDVDLAEMLEETIAEIERLRAAVK